MQTINGVKFYVFVSFLPVLCTVQLTKRITMKTTLLSIILLVGVTVHSQTFVTRDIKSFGAKGDGKNNDHEAFQKAAAFFNARGGNGKLVISKGTYIVGKQTFNKNTTSKPVYEGVDVLYLSGVKNVTIEGVSGSVIRYTNGLRFGSFDPKNGKAFKPQGTYFTDPTYSATAGSFINVVGSQGIQIKSLELNGNSGSMIVGGFWGDLGIQLTHNGVRIENSQKVTVSNIYVHHFGLDGIYIANKTNSKPDQIIVHNVVSEYNARQGLSWVGGNDLTVTDSKFNHTGRGKFLSAPAAGVDIEASHGPISNGKFINCQFINNAGNGMVADQGPSRDCIFIDCLFWGTSNWSAWVQRPGFIFKNATFHGSFVHGFNAENDKDATQFYDCLFEDKAYEGKKAFGTYLIESNYVKRMRFDNCRFVGNEKKLAWLDAAGNWKEEEKYQLNNCHFIFKGAHLVPTDFVSVTRNVRYKNCTFELQHPDAKNKRYYFVGLNEKSSIDLGGNKMVLPK